MVLSLFWGFIMELKRMSIDPGENTMKTMRGMIGYCDTIAFLKQVYAVTLPIWYWTEMIVTLCLWGVIGLVLLHLIILFTVYPMWCARIDNTRLFVLLKVLFHYGFESNTRTHSVHYSSFSKTTIHTESAHVQCSTRVSNRDALAIWGSYGWYLGLCRKPTLADTCLISHFSMSNNAEYGVKSRVLGVSRESDRIKDWGGDGNGTSLESDYFRIREQLLRNWVLQSAGI